MTLVEPKNYSIPESAKKMSVCDATVWNLVRKGVIPSIKIGQRRFITAPTLQAILNGELDLSK